MNRFFITTTIALLCVCTAACAKTPPDSPKAASMQEVESMVQPVEISEAPAISSEPAAAEASAAESSVADSSAAVPSAPADEISQPDAAEPISDVQSAVAAPEPSSSVPELLPYVSVEQKLNCEKIESELLRLINEERMSAGVEPLGIEDNMLFAARIRAGEAVSSFSHTRPGGMPYNTAFDEAGFSYAGKWHGENLASISFTAGMFDEAAAALEMFSGLKNSPGHYRNMVSDNFLQTGIGVAIVFGAEQINIASAQLFSSL